MRRNQESWNEAIERDTRDLVSRYRELPSIERYLAAIDPRREPAAACSAVLAAFDAAVTWTDVLAEAWRARYPAWSDAIDAAVGASSLDLDPQEVEALGQRIGPVAFDGHGRYELLERIGRGASGRVFRAVDHVFAACGEPGEVAVKLIPCGSGEIAGALREAGHARRISHGGVARVLDAGRVDPAVARELGCGDPAIFIVQEFVHGQPLWIWRACHPERAASTCDLMMANIREALDACHEGGISHGDLNPANVLVEPGGRTRIIDFGRSFRSHEVGALASLRHDEERLDAIRGWLLRDLHRTGGGARSRAAGVAAAVALVGFVIVATPFLPRPSGAVAGASTKRPRRPAAPEAAVAAASAGRYQVVRQPGRLIMIPNGRQEAGLPTDANIVGLRPDATLESVLLLDPGMVTVKIPKESFDDLFGDPTGEVTPEGLAVYRIPRERLEERLGSVNGEALGKVPAGGTADAPATAAATATTIGDAMLRSLFGDSIFELGQKDRLALAKAILANGPVIEAARADRQAIAARLAAELRSREASGRHDSGLDALTAAAFLSADVGVLALDHALKAAKHGATDERRALARAIEAIASRRTGLNRKPLDAAEIDRLARRVGAPGLTRLLHGG